MTSRRRKTKAVLQVVGAAVVFSTGGAAIKTAAFSAMQVASIRSGIAATMLLIWFRGRLRWSWAAVAVAVVYAATLVLFVAATKLTTAASAIFLQSTAPVYVALLGPVLGERVRARDIGILAAVGVGLAVCLIGGSESTVTAPDPRAGNLLGALCGMTWALTLVGLRWGARAHADIAVSAVVAGNVFACLAGVPFLRPLPAAPAVEWATLGYLGVFQIGVAYILLTAAMGELAAVQVSLLLLLEPALNPLWAWLVRGEAPGGWALAGGAVILAASGTKAFMDAAREEA